MRISAYLLAFACFLAGCSNNPALSFAPQKAKVSINVSPASANLSPGQTQAFIAAVQGASNAGVVWTATGGTITANGVFTAGASAGSYSVTASSAANSSASASAQVTIQANPISVSISPASVSLAAGATQQFSATVSNSSNTGVNWTATGGVISATGLYTAGSTAGNYNVTASSAADAAKSASAAVGITAAQTSTSSRLFPASSANWLYSAPTGSPLNISNVTSGMTFNINAHDGGYDYPVQYTDGTHGCTTFTDAGSYGFNDNYCVPNPTNGFHPSWGSDGHLIVVNSSTGSYYDFWKLTVNSSGQPLATNVGAIFSGTLQGDGTPGTTAAFITGLAGDILPGELNCDTCLNHAVLVIVPGSMDAPGVGDQGPVHHYDGSVSGALFKEGAKIRFDPSINVAALSASTATKALLRALQLYGGLIVDQTGCNCFGIYSALATTPDKTGMNLIGQHLWLYY